MVNWQTSTFRLTFRFGMIRIGSVAFRSLVPEGHPFKLPVHPDFDILPLDALGSTTESIILRSHPIQTRLERLSKIRGTLCYVPETYRHHYVDLSGTFAEYLSKFSSKTRSTLLSKVRRLKQEGVEFQAFRSAEELLRFYPLARQVSLKTYQESLLKQGLPDSPEFEAALRLRGEQDTARGFLLMKGSNPIAYLYSPATDGVLLYEYLGYDTEFRQSSPGTVLQYLALEYLFAEQKFEKFDFEEGEGQHKQMFATHSVECADIFVFAPTIRAHVLVRMHMMLTTFVRTVLVVTDRMHVKKRLKRVIKMLSSK